MASDAIMRFRPPARFTPAKGPPRLSSRDRVLAQWRGQRVSQADLPAGPRLRTSADVIPRVLKDLKIDRRQAETEILKVWNHLIDPNVAAHAQPTGIHKGTLFVKVDSDVWRVEILRYRRREILQRLQHAFGSDLVKKISFSVG